MILINEYKKVLTIVSKNIDTKLHTLISKVIINYLRSLNIQLIEKKYLKKYKAIDYIFFDKNKVIKHNGIFRRLKGLPVDFCIQMLSSRKKKLFLTDMDGTIIKNETLNDIARFLGKGEQVKKITDLGMKGRLDFSTSLNNRVEILKGLKISSLEMAKKNITFMGGASELFKSLNKNKIYTVLISGGFKPITTYVKETLKINEEFSNTFGIEGDLFSGTVSGTVVNASYKEVILNRFKKNLSLKSEQIVSMGDAANDLNMLLSSGLAIAYKATDVVKANVDNQINNTDISSLMYFLDLK